MTPTPPEGPDQGPEHNPDGLTPEQYGAPVYRLLRKEELASHDDEWCSWPMAWEKCDHEPLWFSAL